MIVKRLIVTFVIALVIFSAFAWFLISKTDIFSKKYYDTLRFETYGNVAVVPVKINTKTYHFIFDTGAPTTISPELFTEFKLSALDSVKMRDYYGNKKTNIRTIIPSLTVGNTTFSDVRVGVLSPIPIVQCNLKIDGYLGNDIFSKGIVQIDIEAKTLLIASTIEEVHTDNASSVDVVFDQCMLPYLQILFTGKNKSEKVLFDTGSPNGFYRLEKNIFLQMYKDSLLRKANIMDTLGIVKNNAGLFGKQKDTEIFFVRFDSLNLLGQTIYNCPAYTFTSGASSILGSPFLRIGVITIDYRHRKFYFKPYYQNTRIDLAPFLGFIMTGNRKGDIVVETVLRGSVAEKNGIKTSYILKKVNSVVIDSLTMCDMLNFNWRRENERDTISYAFLTPTNDYLNVKIKVK